MAKQAEGWVYLVGAGPGDAGLLTVRGAALLARADVVIYDALIGAGVLRLIRPGAELIYGGKRSKRAAMHQGELNDLLVAKAREGKTVVRLKGGDPYTFGRGGEEAAQLAAAGVRFEVVPGVSSVVAAPNYAGIPLTHREHCSSFTVITGHEDPAESEAAIDWSGLAKLPGTKVVMMGLDHLREILARLVQEGMAPETPVAMIRWGTTARQQSIEGTLATMADVVERTGFGAPAITVIGDVVRLRGVLNWYEKRPLFGRRVVVTRARGQAAEFAVALEELGADVLEVPVIRFGPPTEHQPLVEALAGLNAYDWLIFTSANGVEAFFDAFFKAFQDLRDIGGVRIAAVGPATAARLRALHLQVDLMPADHDARHVAQALKGYESIENLRVLLMRAERGTPDLPRLLEDGGAIVDDVACYRTEADSEDPAGAGTRLLEEGADWVTFTSGSTVQHFHERFDLPALLRKYPKLRVASIGPETSKALRALGARVNVEAKPHTTEGLIQGMLKAEQPRAVRR